MKHPSVTFIGRALVFALIWLLLTGGSLKNWGIGLCTVSAAALSSLHLWPRHLPQVRWRGGLALLVYFGWNSIVSGVDVARRAFAPGPPQDAALLEYRTQVRSELGQALLAWMISLMPGTAAINWAGPQQLTVHVIDRHRYDEQKLQQLELRLQRAFAGPV